MHVEAALHQLSEIHAQLLRSEVFRGYRSRSMAATAGMAVLGAWVQQTWQMGGDGDAFARFWAIVAVLGLGLCAADLCLSDGAQASANERWRSLRVVGQIAPAFAAGAVIPLVLLRPEVGSVSLLPGLWALVFGLAVFASRPFLPRAVGWVGLWYCGAGIVQLLTAEPGVPGPWSMGITFGVGQTLAALVLRLGIERPLGFRGRAAGRSVRVNTATMSPRRGSGHAERASAPSVRAPRERPAARPQPWTTGAEGDR